MEHNANSVSEIAHVNPTGEIDMQTWEDFAAKLGTALDSGAQFIDLDLEQVSFLDSSGIRVIVECANSAKENGVAIHVRNARGEVQRALQISGIIGPVVSETPIPA